MTLRTAHISLCTLLLQSHALHADVRLLGKADAGEHVSFTIGAKAAEADADNTGRWQVKFNLKDSTSGPFEMTVEGRNRVVIRDAVIGEVWLASGQSNMELPLRVTADADAEIANSANPQLRQIAVRKTGVNQPMEECDSQWTVAGPEASGEFTAIGYYFGKELQQSRHMPAGIIHASNGGTFIEHWTPAVALNPIEEFRAPVAVSYAWADNPTCNLSNAAGIPAPPFRTDDFRTTTANSRY